MKYTGTSQAKAHGNPTVYNFTIGKEELVLMKALVASAVKYTPKTTETSNAFNRLTNFRKVLSTIK